MTREEQCMYSDAMFALQTLVEHVNALDLLSRQFHRSDWTAEELLQAAKEWREYCAGWPAWAHEDTGYAPCDQAADGVDCWLEGRPGRKYAEPGSIDHMLRARAATCVYVSAAVRLAVREGKWDDVEFWKRCLLDMSVALERMQALANAAQQLRAQTYIVATQEQLDRIKAGQQAELSGGFAHVASKEPPSGHSA